MAKEKTKSEDMILKLTSRHKLILPSTRATKERRLA